MAGCQPRSALGLAVAALLVGSTLGSEALAQSFPATISLGTLNGTDGFRLDGAAEEDGAGISVSTAGDVNGDGFDDLIIGASEADPVGNYSGSSYVFFGRSDGYPSVIALSSLDGSEGFRIDGESVADYSGSSVAAAGDVNDDGVADLIVGARRAGNSLAGSSYVVFGSRSGFPAVVPLLGLDGSNGFRFDGLPFETIGVSVDGAGDINGDGIDDIIVGAPGGIFASGYVIYGSRDSFPAQMNPDSLEGGLGFRVEGASSFQSSGFSVSAAGDVNGDGLDDVIVGGPQSDASGQNAGTSHVLFGRSTPFSTTTLLSGLDGSDGFRIDGAADSDVSGWSVSEAGDINGDGLADILVGAPFSDAQFSGTGNAYVVYGRHGGFSASLSLSDINGSNGFRLEGVSLGDFTGGSVSSAGDVNGDGIDDLMIGARSAWANGWFAAGRTYVVFGRDSGFPANFALSTLNGSNGFVLEGLLAQDGSGISVSAAGDINGDGLGDMLIGASRADPNGSKSGSSYVVFGRHSGAFFRSGFEALPPPL